MGSKAFFFPLVWVFSSMEWNTQAYNRSTECFIRGPEVAGWRVLSVRIEAQVTFSFEPKGAGWRKNP